ncbi:hypothetical protein MRX96_012336 [Rhipicephalus microplus]
MQAQGNGVAATETKSLAAATPAQAGREKMRATASAAFHAETFLCALPNLTTATGESNQYSQREEANIKERAQKRFLSNGAAIWEVVRARDPPATLARTKSDLGRLGSTSELRAPGDRRPADVASPTPPPPVTTTHRADAAATAFDVLEAFRSTKLRAPRSAGASRQTRLACRYVYARFAQ